MSRAGEDALAGCLGLIIAIPLIGGLVFTGSAFMGWLVVLVAKGLFRYDLPYWPTVAAWFVVGVLLAKLRPSKEAKS